LTSPVPPPDLLLARRAAAGQTAAWEEIVDLHGGRLFNLALQFATTREEAEDLTQEIFLRLFRTLRQYRGEVPFLAWALALARNLCIDRYRSARRERQVARTSPEVLELLPSGDDPEREVEHQLRLEAVYEALARMSEEHAQAVVLRDLLGLSEEESAAFLAVPAGTIKSRLHRARKELAERLTPRPAPGAAAREAAPC
jgi:RNA polymerase sigma-70 factor (ECF subfamily)